MIPQLTVHILLALSLLLFFVKLGMPFLDPDEGLYATIAHEMLSRGDWIIPHMNGLPYLEKPPLYFWLTALTFQLFGLSEWATRLWSALAALGTVLLTWRIGRRLYGRRAGLLAGLVIATVVGNTLYVRKASTDQLFVFCLTLAMYGFLRDAERADRGRARFLLFYLGAALAVLAKGFIGVVFPVLIVGLGMAVVRRLSWRELNLVRGAALFAVVAVPWHALVLWRSPRLFDFYVVDNHILRFLARRRGVGERAGHRPLARDRIDRLWRRGPLGPLGGGRADAGAGAERPGRAQRVLPHLARSGDPFPVPVGPSVRRPLDGARAGPARGLGAGDALLGPRLAPERLRLARWSIGVITVLIFRLLDVVEPQHSVKAINAQAGAADVLVVEGALEYSPSLPFYNGRQALLVNGATNSFSVAATLPEARPVH